MRTRRVIVAALVAWFTAAAPRPAEAASPELAERYYVNGDSSQVVIVTRLSRDYYMVVGKGWDGVGLLAGASYWGVFRHSWGSGASEQPDATGTHRGLVRRDSTLAIHGEYTSGLTGTFDVIWTRKVLAKPPAPEVRGGEPAPGEYVAIDELPEALTKVPPSYPDAARRAKVEGTVLVQALVGADGAVKDTRVLKSVSGLDGAAIEAVRRWVFKPATREGKPVAVWVSVPIKFPPP